MENTKTAASTRWHDITVNHVSLSQPLEWLSKGWKDILEAGRYSLNYGAVIVLVSGLMTLGLILTETFFLVPFLAAGFFLVAPAIGIGLYQMSAHMEKGEPLKTCNALEAWKRNQAQISIVTAGFLIIMQLWMAANFVLFALLYSGISPPLGNFFSNVFLSEEGRAFAIASVTVGFVLAWAAYAISAVSVPMLMDRKVDGFTAIRTSIKGVLQNFSVMTFWALLIVVIIGLGLLTCYIGLIVALPLVAHASWHAYRDLVPLDSGVEGDLNGA